MGSALKRGVSGAMGNKRKKDFAEHPLKEERPLDLFQEKQLKEII